MRRRVVAGVAMLAAVLCVGIGARPADAAAASRLIGKFTVDVTVTGSTNPVDPIGLQIQRVYTFSPACATGPCTTVLDRVRRNGTTVTYNVTVSASGDYHGTSDYLGSCIANDTASTVIADNAYNVHEVIDLHPTASTGGLVTAFTGTLDFVFSRTASAPASCPSETETIALSGTLTAQPPSFLKYPHGLVFPGPDGTAQFSLQAVDPAELPVTISWTSLPAGTPSVTCVNTANPAVNAIVTCTIRNSGANFNPRTITFTATDPLGGTATKDVRVGPPLYVAMGDSYASGEGAPPFDPTTDRGADSCHRSRKAGALQFAANPGRGQPSLKNRFVACSGARTADMASSFKTETPQYTVLGQDVTLASVSIGGNDVGFADILATCIATFELDGQSCRNSAQPAARSKLAALDTRDERTGLTPLQTVYKRIQLNMAPGGHLLVVGYPRLFGTGHGKHPRGCEGVNTTDAKWINSLLADGNAVIRRNAEAVGAKYVDLAGPFSGHGLCDTQTNWINGVRFTKTHGIGIVSKESFHPNAQGQNVIARALAGAYLSAG